MKAETLNNDTLFSEMDETVSQLQSLMSSLDEQEINKVPYLSSWTAAMLFQHIGKSTNGMAKAMLLETKPAGREADERVPKLKENFLNFSKKMEAPDMVVPEAGAYEKQATIDKLNRSFERLKESANNQDLTGLVSGLPFGDITKLEILHFVLYHTQRHLQQMKRICDALEQQRVLNGHPDA